MAELNVQPKSKSPWWIWLIVAIIVIGILSYFLSGNNENDAVPPNTDSDTTGVTGMTRTEPNWNNLAHSERVFLYREVMQNV